MQRAQPSAVDQRAGLPDLRRVHVRLDLLAMFPQAHPYAGMSLKGGERK